MFRAWIQRQLVTPILQLLRQGITPEKIALSIAFGAVLGCMPFLGVTTTLCFLVAFLLRLNPVAIQLINYLMYPIQLALFIPFIRAGEKLFHTHPLAITLSQLEHLVKTNMVQAVKILWTTLWHAVTVWAALAPLGVLVLYLALLPIMRYAASRLAPTLESEG